MIIKRHIIILFIGLMLLPSSDLLYAQSNPIEKSRVLFIFDASQSMLSRWQSGRKIDVAKRMLNSMMDSLKNIPDLEVALRVYGHQSNYPPQDCNDTKLEIDFVPANLAADKVKTKLSMIRAKGTTPIAKALEEGAKDFPNNEYRNIVILITDGKEECDMDPCSISRLYQRKGIILKPFVIGIGLDNEWKKSFDCVGSFFDASKEKEFINILNIVISHIKNNTTTQVNLLDIEGYPTETNINLTFYDNFSGVQKYNFIHTLNNKGNPDTLIIDPVLSYKVIAHTIPKVESEIIKLTAGSHNIIPINAAQGELEIKMNSKTLYSFVIKKAGKNETINLQKINTKEKYLIGKYDIELFTLPRMYFTDVGIEQSSTTAYSIPESGTLNILLPSKGYGGIYEQKEDELELIYKFNGKEDRYRLDILPGKYKIIFRSKKAKKSLYTKIEEIRIKSGESKIIKMY